MHIITNFSEEFWGTPQRIVEGMTRSQRWHPALVVTAPLVFVYMRETAERVALWNGQVVRTSTEEHFVHDLCRVGLCTRVHPDTDTCDICAQGAAR